jgi:hypothetical protein
MNPPPVLNNNQINPVYGFSRNIPMNQLNIILPFMPWCGLFPFVFPTKTPYAPLVFPHNLLHDSPILLFLIWSPELYLLRSTHHLAPHYVVFSKPLLPPPSKAHTFSLKSFFQKLQIRFFPQCEWPRAKLIQNRRQNYSSLYVNLYIFRKQTWRQNIPHQMTSICSTWIEFRHIKFLFQTFKLFPIQKVLYAWYA